MFSLTNTKNFQKRFGLNFSDYTVYFMSYAVALVSRFDCWDSIRHKILKKWNKILNNKTLAYNLDLFSLYFYLDEDLFGKTR